jgi:CRISPR-associated protein Cas1
MSSPTATRYRVAQYDTFRNPKKVTYLQKQVLKAKLESAQTAVWSSSQSETAG